MGTFFFFQSLFRLFMDSFAPEMTVESFLYRCLFLYKIANSLQKNFKIRAKNIGSVGIPEHKNSFFPQILLILEIDAHSYVKLWYQTLAGNHQLNAEMTQVIDCLLLLQNRPLGPRAREDDPYYRQNDRYRVLRLRDCQDEDV